MAATDYEYFDITQPYSLPQRNWTKNATVCILCTFNDAKSILFIVVNFCIFSTSDFQQISQNWVLN